MKIYYILFHIVFIGFLTIVSQVLGIIWLATLILKYRYGIKKRFSVVTLYLVFYFVLVTMLAILYNKKPLPIYGENIKAHNIMYGLLFRN